MKKILLILCAILMLFLPFSTVAFADPLPGIWNASDLGIGVPDDAGIFEGKVIITDPEQDGATLGDKIYARDNSSSSYYLHPYYWSESGLTRDWFSVGSFVDEGGGVGTRTFETTRTGGTFVIYGDHLWGQSEGSTYTASIQEQFSGTAYFDWIVDDPETEQGHWQWNRTDGWISWWGTFDDYQYSIEVTAFNSIFTRYEDDTYGWVMYGTLDDVEIKIEPIPEPATMLLLGSGLVGLAGFRKKKFKK